jgi:tetratricopeptide (TPR) repeat protein
MLKIDQMDPFKLSIAVAVALGCLSIPIALAQSAGSNANAEMSSQFDASTPNNADNLTESGIQPDAMQMYLRAVRELHQGHAVPAEKDANHALQMDPKFADAAALAATAALMQQQFQRAAAKATQAVQINAADEKAYVILATAQNYLGDYSAAADALRHVRPQEQQTWQVAYQWARAEAGLQHLPECLEWLNRAALSAPVNFAPLHLLRASALLAMGDNARAADELEIYLQFPSANPSQRDLLTQELRRLHLLPQSSAAASAATGN